MGPERTSGFLKAIAFLDFLVRLAATGALYGVLIVLLNILNEIRRMSGDNFYWNVVLSNRDTVAGFRVALVSLYSDAMGQPSNPIWIQSGNRG